ncbi:MULTISPECIES: FAD-dependent oxidoreductase [unclassified Mesorhizobium]|uniref:FAD-dependent oxidoreductase n=1 Tax=unclassified Mesorhizobium TaxID=325217 RepID=UPI001091F55A|nr:MULTISPECIES: FAD-dependent oxidoreductase [unclassified Mesorhizobium]TGU40074.1 FAD-dependent oxidoreductase [bacterium M00.F.Ca.ET.156.01.1.1]TGV15135.1 FAD-dependent oxidoreductase [Mesorhizobium sp. M8A.F.Ca.ET.173.01.1.1]TGQ77272.1 FAD-dependent oxidoreductase [Mesorhizobium sp. M8A.F.Ca.ET.207.01.1.1]TGQ89091.1 FAD-dependent oxidoreductase [Mesorhizobium sp. M8A.F.Ca.ET.208.01.1.1]TGR32196.1 FAD-dependent oxidoreductase [Mesorhizobium sp. M8A.F.Ca.ET.202.01.1.1]
MASPNGQAVTPLTLRAPSVIDLGKRRPLWLDQAFGDDFPGNAPLSGNHKADVVIVGGGYVGLWTALELKRLQPSLDVALVERKTCGSGASGRNAGFAMPWWLKILTLEEVLGREEALKLCIASEDAVAQVISFCETHCPEAQPRKDGWMWAASTPAHVGRWEATVRKLEELGKQRFTLLGAKEIQERIGTNTHLSGVYDPNAATLHPGYLVRGLRRRAIELGVRVYENSPMLEIRDANPAVVVTKNGTISAPQVVLANNAWSANHPAVKGRIVVIAADLLATSPIPQRLAQLGWTNGTGVINARQRIQVYRTTPDGRIYFGRGGGGLAFGGWFGDRYDSSPKHSRETAEAFQKIFPMLADVKISHNWTAPIDMTPTGLPFFGRFGKYKNVSYGVGWSGYGVALSHIGGRILSSMALELKNEWSECGLVDRPAEKFPPEPFRYLGGKLVQAAVTAKEKSDDSQKKPTKFVSLLSRLAPKH